MFSKKQILVCVSLILPLGATAANSSNPFDLQAQADEKIEPNGLVSYSFNMNPSDVIHIESDRSYLMEAQQTTQFGYSKVDRFRINDLDSEIKDRVALHKKRKREFLEKSKLAGIQADSSFNKTSLSRTPSTAHIFQDVSNEISFGAGTYSQTQGWDTTVDSFQSKQLGRVIIEKWNYIDANGGVLLDSDAVNIYINGVPGVLIARDGGEKSETVLAWVDDTTSYTIRTNTLAGSGEGKQKLLELARFISTSNTRNEF